MTKAQLSRATLGDSTQLDAKWLLVWSILNEGGTGRDLTGADVTSVDLTGAEPQDANLRGAVLEGAHLSGAKLTGAVVNDEQLAQAASLRGATLPDGTVHE